MQYFTPLGLAWGYTTPRRHRDKVGLPPPYMTTPLPYLAMLFTRLCAYFYGISPHVHYYLFSDAEFHRLFHCLGTQEDMVRHVLQCQRFGISRHCHFTQCSLFPNRLCYFEQHKAQRRSRRSLARDPTSSVTLLRKLSISSYHVFPTAKTVMTPKDTMSSTLLWRGPRWYRWPEPSHTA